MTSIQDAWGVYTLDDRSDTTISVPKACKSKYQSNNMYTQNAIQVQQVPQHKPQEIFIPKPMTLVQTPNVEQQTESQQLLGMLNLLLIFTLIDKLFAIWNKS